jgi:hypothetical protein
MSYANLPGVQVQTVDGGLAALATPQDKSTLILGSAGNGPCNTPYQVTNKATAESVFGYEGSLSQALEEVATYCDNIFLFRYGTKAATLSGIGADSVYAGYSVIFGEVASTTGTDYQIWYNDGILYIWLSGNLVYSNDPENPVDTTDSVVTGTAVGGQSIGNQGSTAKTTAGALTVSAAAAVTGTTLVYVPCVTGLNMTGRQVYIAAAEALDLLTNFAVQQVICPEMILDQPNVAFYLGGTGGAANAVNNPSTNPDALDWLLTTTDQYGNLTYHWASESKDSNGNPVSPVTFTSATERLGLNYHEVNFGYQLARFAEAQSEVLGGCVAFVGCSSPPNNRYDLPSIRKWIGYLPTYNPTTGNASVSGGGLLGIPYLTGCSAATLNYLCADADLGYRLAGFFETDTNEYDGGVDYDQNNYPIDIGAYLHVVGDTALLQNGYGQYLGNVAGVVAGLHSSLDPKNALTNEPVISVTQLYRASLGQLDSLTQAKIDMLRYGGAGTPPVCLHDRTAAGDQSDYIFLLRQDIKFLVAQVLFTTGGKFIGKSSTDGLQMQAMQTALDAQLQSLQKNSYISSYSFTVSTTVVDYKIGRATINVRFNPANELVQLFAVIGIQIS